ncbi:MAG: hypothetical protein R3F43_09070 [bacterium]
MARLMVLGACLLVASVPVGAEAGPFEQDVDAAIADGLRWLRDQQAFTGGNTGSEAGAGLLLLVLAEAMADGYQGRGGPTVRSPGRPRFAS